jgi:capsular polysaccharide biosynthesis protein
VDLKMFLTAVTLYWKTFALTTVSVLSAGAAALVLTPIQYVSSTQLLVSINGSTTATAYQNDDLVAGRVNSYIALLTSDAAAQRVIDKINLRMTPAEFAAKVSATRIPPSTSLIDIAVTDRSPSQAQRLADTLAREFVIYTDALEAPTGEDAQKVRTTVVTAASQPHPRLVQRIALGALVALAALLLGGVAVWLRSITDPVARTAHRATAAVGVPVFGEVTSAPASSLKSLEGYRLLRTRLRSVPDTNGARVSMVASAAGEVLATAVASNMGRVADLGGSHSVVVDADLANTPEEGAGGSAGADEDLALVVHTAEGIPDTLSMNMWAAQPDEVATEATSTLFTRLRDDYDAVILAAPPILTTLTASVASEYADAVLLLAVPGATKCRDLSLASERLRSAGAPLVGLVLVIHEEEDRLEGDPPAEQDDHLPTEPPKNSRFSRVKSLISRSGRDN